MSDTRDTGRGSRRVTLRLCGIFAATAVFAGSAAAQGTTTVLKEDFDQISINSTYSLTNTAGTAANILSTEGPEANVLRLTHLNAGNNNSAAWDFVSYAADEVVLSFLFSMTDDADNDAAEGCCGEAADGFGIGLFSTGDYGTSGPSNPAGAGGVNWEDPAAPGGSGFLNALVIGFDVFDFGGPNGNNIRITGLGGSTEILGDFPAPFTLNNNLFHKAIVTLKTDGGGGGRLSMELIEDFNGAAVAHQVATDLAVPGIDPTLFEGRLIAGGRTGSAFVETLLECVQIETRELFEKSFSPATIGPGSVSTLTFTINNDSATGLRDLSFVDTLPAGVTIASPPNIVSDCEGTVVAPAGGSTISFSGGRVPANGNCSISVDVTAPEPGTYENISGVLSSDAGALGRATATLDVVEELPGFSKSFSPPSVNVGGRSTLTFTIDNSANEGERHRLTFTDTLPAGMVVADPPNASTTCAGGIITAVPGTDSISYAPDFGFTPAVGAFQTCTVSVDVIAVAAGQLHNISGELTSTSSSQDPTPISSGKASATLEVEASELSFSKEFIDDPVPPGGTATLEFTITNNSRDSVATGITFTDNLSSTLPGLVAVNLPQVDVCGDGSLLTGNSTITLRGGSLAPGASCTFNVDLQVPAQAQPGAYDNTTSSLSAIVAGDQLVASPATDTLFVAPVPIFTKEFIDDPVTAGDTVTLEFSITNTSATSNATAIAFVDELPGGIASAPDLPSPGFCGAGSTIFFTPSSQFDPARLTMNGGELRPLETCTFSVVLQLDPTISSGIHTNTTEPITATIDDQTVTGPSATDDLFVVSAPQLSKEWIDDPVRPGSPIKLRFTLTHPAEAPVNATEISFSDDLGAVIPGMVAVGLPQNNVCGAGSLLRSTAGNSVITLTGGRLQPGQSCSFIVECLVPQEVDPGVYTNTTSAVTARVGGLATSGSPASAVLRVTDLTLTKEFSSEVAAPGETVDLTFTIRNTGSAPATGISFTDDLDAMIPGLRATGLPLSNICGAGSSLTQTGSGQLQFQGGSLGGNSSCTFTVTLQIPAATPDNVYSNSTSEMLATIGNTTFPAPPAVDDLEVTSLWIELTKQFLTNPANPGQVIGLEFTLTNLDPLSDLTDIAFTDTLPSGLVAVSPTQNGICGAGSQVSGANTISFTGGRLPAGGSCTFSVAVEVSAEATPGELENITSEVTGVLRQIAVRGDPASATLVVELPPPPAGSVAINSIVRRSDGSTSLSMTTVPEVRYCLQWTEDFVTWTDALVVIGEIEPVEIVDSGPPTFPPATGRRFYRLVEKTLEP